ncbi:MAG: hypothetical protein J5I59_03870 [Saprospiraceae bacterium]|nr:hypothetical protein [Saprospiraceae bacterium]
MSNLIKAASFIILFFVFSSVHAQSTSQVSKGAALNKQTTSVTPKKKSHGQSLFAKLDVNKDGKITREEAKNSNLQVVIKNFDNLDTNKDGSLTNTELKGLRNRSKFEKKK